MTYTALSVLLIEDDPGDTYLLQMLLTRAEHVVFSLECADRLATGLTCLGRRSFDIMLLDLSLPDSLALDTIAKVRAHTLDVPIVVLTGLDDEDIAMRAVQAGAQDYLAKGNLDNNILTRSIRYAVERHRLQTALAQARHQEEETLKRAYDELEMRVEQRTIELKRANVHLQEEIAERRKAERERESLVTHLMNANGSLEALTEAVQRSHRENEQLLAAIPSMLIGIEENGRISQWNTKAEATLGLQHDDVIGRLLQGCPLPWDSATVLARVECCRRTQQAI
jgi:DNA-binding response OmpR family regulator